MSIGEEPVECPLCMEPLEIDDISFYPCTCGYQICRFCWHRIRTDENGLCPACRKQYPEDPAEFKPLTEDELVRIKKERRQKDTQRKQKAAENRKHLANVRVVQKNLVFVVGLTPRLADPELLRKHEYFGKFGKIHKVVINQSTAYAGSQGPSSSAYLTYLKSEDALKAIQAVNNAFVDGRTLKASLGTTKYCSHFLKGTQCQKTDCMYLHELGEKAASFTKEEMQLGKHQEYEQRLIEDFLNHQNMLHHSAKTGGQSQTQNAARKVSSPPTIPLSESPVNGGPSTVVNACRESWPSLQQTQQQQQQHNATVTGQSLGVRTDWSSVTNESKNSPPLYNTQSEPSHRKNSDTALHSPNVEDRCSPASTSSSASSTNAPPPQIPGSAPPIHSAPQTALSSGTPPIQGKPGFSVPPHIPGSGGSTVIQSGPYSLQMGANNKPLFQISPDNSLSLFSDNAFARDRQQRKPNVPPLIPDEVQRTEVPDQIPASTSTDWQAAFGFPSSLNSQHTDDDLGFDPWDESSKALADLIQYETQSPTVPPLGHRQMQGPPPPPGFQNQQQYLPKSDFGGLQQSKMAFMAGFNQAQQQTANRPPGFMASMGQKPQFMGQVPPESPQTAPQNEDIFNMKEWQEGLRALLPNINISFGTSPYPNNSQVQRSSPQPVNTQHRVNGMSESPPHWMRSLQQLTDLEASSQQTHNRLPFVRNFPNPNIWSGTGPVQTPPPGFHAEPHMAADYQ